MAVASSADEIRRDAYGQETPGAVMRVALDESRGSPQNSTLKFAVPTAVHC